MDSAFARASYALLLLLLYLFAGGSTGVRAATPIQAGEPTFEEYDPPSSLVVPENPVTRAKYPFVDIHNHQWEMPTQDLDALVADMDALNMGVMVNLSGRGRGEEGFLEGSLTNVRLHHPERFLVFTNISFDEIDEPGWGKRTARQVELDVAKGADGLKIYKSLGLRVKDASGDRVPVDDPRIAPVWDKCGELGVPVLIHSADPKQFWEPWDKNNERWLELKQKPERKQDPSYVTFEQVLAEQHNVFAKHPKTQFINAHMGWLGGDLKRLGKLLDRYPNVMVEIGAVLAELGRQPRFARAFMERYQDRVLFGKDAWAPEEYYVYFRVLETADEYFDYYRKRHAYWKMYGLDLPDEVLRKLYYKNALRLFPQLDRSLFPRD